VLFNHSPIDSKVENGSYTWQIENLPPIKEEPWMPDTSGLAPYLAVSYYPSRGEVTRKSISSWEDVSLWADQLMRREPRVKGIIEAKAKEITANSTSEIERAKSLARWVQRNIRYASIQLSAIGGYRPNPADVVLRKGSGDCKDKSALLQALLRAVGIQSYLTLVYAGDSSHVRAEFPSPLQFNHAIVAIAINANLPSSGDDARLGRFLFFDPTDDTTPLGQLPFYLQGSLGLVVKGESGNLVRLPAQEEEANKLCREITIEAGASGEVTAQVIEVYTGQMAALARRLIQSSSAEDYAREMGSRISRDIPGAVIKGLKITGQSELDEPLRIEYEIRAAGYANRMNRLLVIRPLPLRAQQFPAFTQTERFSPVQFDMKSIQEDTVKINLPHGFRIDELPPGTNLTSGFGEFKLDHQMQGGQVIVHRRLAIRTHSVGVSQYADVKRFFDAAQTASQANIVLVSG
ncbi:MAG TPA: transglutaminase-like domain-containing protein, partial [Blastocatellia bacterium]